MKRTDTGQLVFSPSDLIRYLKSPFASWMDRYYLEFPNSIDPDQESEDERLIAETGVKHEADVLEDFRKSIPEIVEVPSGNFANSKAITMEAFGSRAPIIYQAALEYGDFAGLADFVELDPNGKYQVWDTKLARSPKSYYAIQLCSYSELLAAVLDEPLPEKFGIILGDKVRVEFRVEDFIHYFRSIRSNFLDMQKSFDGDLASRPEPVPRADYGRWTSHADNFFSESDHIVQVAGISVGQIKKLSKEGILTVADLATASGRIVPKLAQDSLERLVAQAKLQAETKTLRLANPDSPPRYETLPLSGSNGEPVGLAAIPPEHPADAFFDMEGFPLVPGGLEYLFGLCTREKVMVGGKETFAYKDWWAHNREEERVALEGFVDWVFDRWTSNPGMHIFHYAAYEVSAVRRLSTRHDTRQNEVDELLRNNVFVDLYQIVRRGLRVGEDSYSIKSIERLYRPKRTTEISTALGSVVQYARWIESDEASDWTKSEILKVIRDYNEDDCVSTVELDSWLRGVASQFVVPAASSAQAEEWVPKEIPEHIIERGDVAFRLRGLGDPTSIVLADLIDFHRREDKPMWWRMFDRAVSSQEELCDDAGCIEGVEAIGEPEIVKLSVAQPYRFDPSQECKLSAGEKSRVMFTHNLEAKFTLVFLDTNDGKLQLKIGNKALSEKFGGEFPSAGSLIPDEYVSADPIPAALAEVAASHLTGNLRPAVASFLNRVAPATKLQVPNESTTDAAIRVVSLMDGDCLLIQGPPGTGKTYTASHVIKALLALGKKVGISSNSHKAVINLMAACGEALSHDSGSLTGIKVGGEAEGKLFDDNPNLTHVGPSSEAFAKYKEGVVGGTAWLFARAEWEGALDFLFIDEAGQVSLANAVAMARCAKNLVLLGDQMQLEQPIQGSHPGDAGLSALQYALKDTAASNPDAPVLHAVVPSDLGIFLGESRRMHPNVCEFISESIYDGKLGSHSDCARQSVSIGAGPGLLVNKESGVVFSAVEHDGNIQHSEEEIERVLAIYHELLGRSYTAKDGIVRSLGLQDFLFIAPYNAQVRALKSALPEDARVGSVDKFQGQEAPVCILSLCSSFGEYGSRGLGFILDRNRVNVAVSRAQCLAIVVADPRIAGSTVNSIDEMKLVNLFCKIVNASHRA